MKQDINYIIMCFKNKICIFIKNIEIYFVILLYHNPLYICLILTILYIPLFIYSADTVLCDGDYDYYKYNGRVTDYLGVDPINRVVGGELDSRPITYQPYRPGLHATSGGFRYEMEAPSNCYELDGNPKEYLNNQNNRILPPHAYEERLININRPENYSIEPLDSEYYRDSYAITHNQSPIKTGFIERATNGFKKIVKYASDDLQKTRVKAAKDWEKSRKLNSQIQIARDERRRIANNNEMNKLYSNIYGRPDKNTFSSNKR